MGIRDDIATLDAKHRTFALWAQTAPHEDVTAIETVCRDVTIPAETIVRMCRKNNIPITANTVKSFR